MATEVRRRRAPRGRPAAREETQARLAAIALELKLKRADLQAKHSVHVKLELIAACRVEIPVLAASLRLERRKGTREIRVFWNPLTKAVEPLACEGCLGDAGALSVCDDRLHLLCGACGGACRECLRPFCRACHPSGCPRCVR
jgi:hypothetical protein